MYSVVDIAGTNSLLRRILSNAAGAIVGMAEAYKSSLELEQRQEESGQERKRKKKVGLTMFGVTTPAIDSIRTYLESSYEIECFVFHCTGHGGLAMERLIAAGELDAVIDLTTTEIADYVGGGVMSAGEHRLEEALKQGIPCVISLGAVDMVGTFILQFLFSSLGLFACRLLACLLACFPACCWLVARKRRSKR